MTVYVFADRAGKELARVESSDNPGVAALGLGDRFSDTNGHRVRIVGQEIEKDLVRWIVEPWSED